ncbi:uncharacterized protein [Cherax quadricarinatus]|uniref:uncharacterized protein n=1 Tax=Cherax quadricarinatus TaxID=27406 RepID=UPI00387E2494
MLTGRPPAAFPRLLWSHLCSKLLHGAPRHPGHTRALVTSVVRGEEMSRKARHEGGEERVVVAAPQMTEESIRQLVASLTVDQRTALITEIHLVQAVETKKKAEEKLASWRWRSRFGRPASLHALGPDPTGTYCEIPTEWLQKKVAEKTKPKAPTVAELRQLAVHNALPFIGFGFLDNFIMIVAGDYIDVTIGTALGISTMGAAALGNTISDLAGIGSAWYVENIAVKIGIRAPELSQEQLDRWSSRWSANAGRGIGVVLGCLLGMFPLMFLPNHDEDKKTTAEC